MPRPLAALAHQYQDIAGDLAAAPGDQQQPVPLCREPAQGAPRKAVAGKGPLFQPHKRVKIAGTGRRNTDIASTGGVLAGKFAALAGFVKPGGLVNDAHVQAILTRAWLLPGCSLPAGAGSGAIARDFVQHCGFCKKEFAANELNSSPLRQLIRGIK